MKEDLYDKLRKKTERIVQEGLKMAKNKEVKLCRPKCASCLAAEARSKLDIEEYGIGFDSREDVCMIEARDILAKKLKWDIY